MAEGRVQKQAAGFSAVRRLPSAFWNIDCSINV
jgi:hypothetical protein